MDLTIIILMAVVFVGGILVTTIFFEKIKNLQKDQLSHQIIDLLGSINDHNTDMHRQFMKTKKKAYTLNEVSKEVTDIKQDIKRIESDIRSINEAIDNLNSKTNKKRIGD